MGEGRVQRDAGVKMTVGTSFHKALKTRGSPTSCYILLQDEGRPGAVREGLARVVHAA